MLGPSYQDIVQSSTLKYQGESSMSREAAERDYRQFLSKCEYGVKDGDRQETPAAPPSPHFPLLPPPSSRTVSRLEVSRELLRTLFSLLLVIGEAVAWIKLYSGLESSQYESIIYLLCLPTLVTSLCWAISAWRFRLSCSTSTSLLALLLLSLPSPVLL